MNRIRMAGSLARVHTHTHTHTSDLNNIKKVAVLEIIYALLNIHFLDSK